MLITMHHMRKANFCSQGVRAFFLKHNFDWADFLRNGISTEKFIATKDAMALRVVEIAYAK